MVNPKINTLTDVFLSDGFGFFGFGDGGFGGTYDLINPQWNTNSGTFGFDPMQKLPYVEATSSPSYVGASLYDLQNTSFFAKITPAPVGSGTIQTGLLIRFDRHNYVEMSYGPNGQFNAYVSNDSDVTTAAMPVYDATAHAYWRIRNEDRTTMFFDTSPDGATWTQQGSAPYTWDASAVTVTFFAGFTGIETAGNWAYISHVNLPGTTLALSGSTSANASVSGQIDLTDPNALSGSVSAVSGFRASFNATLGIPEGGLTDFAFTSNIQTVDPLITNSWAPTNILSVTGTNPITTSSWFNNSTPITVPMPYRDGSYFQPAAYVNVRNNVSFTPDTNPDLFTNAQLETTTGLDNRLPLNASLYLDSCAYSPGFGIDTVTRSTDFALNGQYSGKIVAESSTTLGDGTFGYLPFPQYQAIVPVRFDDLGDPEALFGSVYLSTSRANTIWFASLIYYDFSFNILSGSTYRHATITNTNTHPGSNIWQAGIVYDNAVPSNAVWVGVIPVVEVSGGFTGETVYTSNNSITTASLGFTEVATAYQHPRTAQINVKADRVNYVLNSGFNSATTLWSQTNVNTSGTPNPASMTWDSAVGYKSAGSMRFNCAVPSGTFTGISGATLGVSTNPHLSGGRSPAVIGLKPGHTYTVSGWIMQGANCPDVFINFYDGNFLGHTGHSLNNQKITDPDNIDGTWTRFQFTYTVPPTGLQDYNFYIYVKFQNLPGSSFAFWLDSLMVEESDTYNGYFDGGFASADYKWEANGTANLSRSYYYRDYNNKFLRLNNALSSVLPVGEYYNLLFAQPIV
jgi:hypothetical protein